MGFLEFKDKIKSLEMFLTDKGKERMLKQNGLGLSELIQRFTCYDDDWDYRKTSQYWQDGASPQPQNTTTPGSTQTLNNDLGLQMISNLQEHFVNPLTASTQWFDITDVRGHRGRPILDCHPVSGTAAMLSCTNIYAFYDVTSVAEDVAIACKTGINSWATNYVTNVNTGWTGSVFHLPVYGERWINSCYYPWHGELDTCSYNIGTFGGAGNPNATTYNTYSGLGGTGNSNPLAGMVASNTVFEGGNSSTTQPFSISPAQNDGTASGPHIYGVTGMWNGTMTNNSYAVNFGVYPPGSTTDITSMNDLRGSKMEWFVTGCTMVWEERKVGSVSYYTNLGGDWNNFNVAQNEEEPICNSVGATTLTNVPFTATPTTTLYSKSYLAGTTWDDPFVQSLPKFDNNLIYSGLSSAVSSQAPTVSNLDVLCQQNCCSDDYRDTGSLFGCNSCGSPFDNIVEQSTGTTLVNNTYNNVGYMFGISDPHHALTASPLTYIAITGTTSIRKTKLKCPCETFKGGDRNVLIISTTDETQVGTNVNNLGGVMPLGVKNYYGKGNVTIGTPDISTISTWNAGSNGNAGGPLNKGYHGGGNTTAGSSTFIANLAKRMGWDYNGVQSYGDHTGVPYAPAIGGPGQPTPDWQYCQDLFMRTRVFYDSFRGFAYPVVKLNQYTYTHFLQHTYGAIMGTTVPYSALTTPNPTIYGDNSGISPNGNKSYPNHPLVALTGYNPYNVLIPVTYTRPPIPYGPTITPAWGNDGSAGCSGQMTETIDVLGNPTCVESVESTWDNVCSKAGLINYGWGINSSVGCLGSTASVNPCTPSQLFLGTNFQTDLTDFITGSTSIYVGYECQYCQCLPAVFINRIGPPDPTVVNPCPNPPCGPIVVPPTIEEVGCGPLPLISSQVRMSTSSLLTATASSRMASDSLYSSNMGGTATPNSMNSLQTLDNVGSDGNWGEMQRDLSTTTNRNARTGLVVDFSAILQPYTYQYNDETYIDYDILFNSETYIGNTKVTKGQVKFNWIMEPGLKPSTLSRFGPELKPCKKVESSEVKKKSVGGSLEDFTYLNSIRSRKEGHHWKYEKDEYCVTLAVEIDGKMQIKTKRIRIIGNKFNGWTINWLST